MARTQASGQRQRSRNSSHALHVALLILGGSAALCGSPGSFDPRAFLAPSRVLAQRLRATPATRVSHVARRVEADAVAVQTGAGRFRFPALFTFFLATAESEVTDLASEVGKALARKPYDIVELVLASPSARHKLLYTLAAVRPARGVWAQVVPRRRDRRMRLHLATGECVGEVGGGPILRVSGTTNATKLAGALLSKMSQLRQEGGAMAVELTGAGKEAAGVMALAIESARFRTQRDLRIKADFKDGGADGPTVLSVTVAFSDTIDLGSSDADDALPAGEGYESEASASADATDASRQTSWTPPATPDLFPTFRVSNRTSDLGLGRAVAQALSSHTSRIVELRAVGSNVTGRMLRFLAVLPQYLDVAAQLAPRGGMDGSCRIRLVKDYPFPPDLVVGEGESTRVSATTDIEKLAGFLKVRLAPSGTEEKEAVAVRMSLMGLDAAEVLVRAFQQFQTMTMRELSFKAALSQTDDRKSMISVTVAAT